jgi:CDP-glycerol glycerophosphotransferase (TagB/SpsB family)
MTLTDAQGSRPRFSIVSAAYNVERYLDDFIGSIEGQEFALDQVEVIVVDDGSTDGTLSALQAWQERSPDLVRVVSQPNEGVASARNAGLSQVRGEWVTFTDPDDVLDPRFLAEVDAFLSKRPETVMVATNRMVFDETTGELTPHTLTRSLMTSASRLRNLDYDSGHFHGHVASAFFRSDLVEEQSLRFVAVGPSFEDGLFCCEYLLHAGEPLVAFLPAAVYRYRVRGDGTSQLEQRWTTPGMFTAVPEQGYLALLRDGAERHGRPPTWLQGMVIYELSWYLRTNERMTAPTAAHGETVARFHELMAQICALLDQNGIDAYAATPVSTLWREMLRHGYSEEPWRSAYAVVDKLDPDQRLMRVTYRYTGGPPEEVFSVQGLRVEPAHQKIRDVRFFDRTLLHERIVWLPLGTLRVTVDGRDLELRTEEPSPAHHRLTPAMIKKAHDPHPHAQDRSRGKELPRGGGAVLRLARSRLVRRYFGDAWVLIDRVFNADDSAEHLFRYLRTHRRGINAWFVIEKGTPDYRRLRRDGYHRVVPHGSLAWKLLMLNAQHLISSHIDEVVVRPKAIRELAEPGWRFTFLQHGVMKDDLSTWFNRKDIDLFVTSTPAEWESVVADHTTYRLTTREVKLTGLPRFDRVLEEGNRFPPEKRDLILIAPTWRQWLSDAQPTQGGRHVVDREELESSQYAREWTAVLNSPELRDLAERLGLTIGLLMHPNFQTTGRLDTPRHVRPLTFEGENVQELFARARVLVTDYSSMFFNAAYIERPIVYFQFDRERIETGWHLGRHGYFDYDRDGFGPVTLTADEAVEAIVKTVEAGPEPEPMYLDRIREAFPERDGRCCERVADAIVASTRPAAPAVRRPLLVERAARRAQHLVRGAIRRPRR